MNLQLFRERNCSPNETKCNQLFVNPLAATTETPRDLLESESLLAIQERLIIIRSLLFNLLFIILPIKYLEKKVWNLIFIEK